MRISDWSSDVCSSDLEADRSGHRSQATVEAQLPQERPAVGGVLVDLAGGDEQRYRYREVEPRPDLADRGRREVDGDPLHRPLEAARLDRRPDAVARLAASGVGRADRSEEHTSELQ